MDFLTVLGTKVTNFINVADAWIWDWPLMVLIFATGILLTVRSGLVQLIRLPRALRYMFQNEQDGEGEVTSFGALCTALSATIGTGNIVGVATAICAGGPGALFWMWLAAFFGMVCWLSNTARLSRTATFWAALSIILSAAWAKTGNGWPKCSHSSAPAPVCWALAP